MTEALYLRDDDILEFSAMVTDVTEEGVLLDQSAFFPTSGGVEHDTGVLGVEGHEVVVDDVVKKGNDILHVVADVSSFRKGMTVHGAVDRDRRWLLSRMHTAAHVLSAFFVKRTGAKITGNRISTDRSRMDFSLPVFDREVFDSVVQEVNEAIQHDHRIEVFFVSREEAEQMPGVSKLAKGLPPGLKELRIVKIGDLDQQADGGPHVNSTTEIGGISVLKLDNRGAQNKRLYYSLSEPS